MNDLFNYGVRIRNDQPCGEEATFIVVGVPRSGTSMVTKCLQAMGVPMGLNMDDSVFEDREFAGVTNHIEATNAAIRRFIQRRTTTRIKRVLRLPIRFESTGIGQLRATIAGVESRGASWRGPHPLTPLAGEAKAALDKLESLVQRNNALFPKWGVKRPSAYEMLTPNLGDFRKPRLIVPFRDPMAISMRNVISMNFKLLPAMERTISQTKRLLDFVKQSRIPAFLFSYEKALTNPEEFVDALAAFAGVTMDAEQRAHVLAQIENGTEKYLEATRLIKEPESPEAT
jgi:Sulfotransferase family